jgi:hypothetical protein
MSIVYILTNESMPGYIKIGRTDTSVQQRMAELDKTSVPLPFQCFYAARVDDYAKVERTLHTAFGDARVRASREFFQLDPYRAKVVLELIAIEDVTPSDDTATDDEGREALERLARRGTRFNFLEYGIPVGSILQHAQDQSITCAVVDEQNVDFRGETVSISRAAGLANLERGGSSTSLAGTNYWLFHDETLASIRQRLNKDW